MVKTKRRTRPTALGVHIFAGGFTCGVKQSGFDVVAHLEDTKYGVSTALANWPDLDVRVGEENWQLDDFIDKIDFLYSNPPCAIFSTAGISTTKGPDAWKQDPRLGCWYRAFKVFETVRPKVFALESVCQAYTKGREVINNFTRQAVTLGYAVQHVLMNAKWTGIPQSRKRFFFVAHWPWLPLEFRFDFVNPPTVGELLAKVSDPGFVNPAHKKKKIHVQCMKKTPQGGKLSTTFDDLKLGTCKNSRGAVAGRPGFLYSRLQNDSQMGTFIGDVFIHPNKHRFLGLNEMKILCGYPQEFNAAGAQAQAPSLLARAVLPSVGKWLGIAVRNVLSQPKREYCKQVVTLADIRKPFGKYSDLTQEYSNNTGVRYSDLLKFSCQVKSCQKCSRMLGRYRVMSQLNGSVTAKVLFIGEAPGKDGAGVVGIPFCGDVSGMNFETLIKSIQLTRNDIFITNAVLCNPLGTDKKNATPSYEEIDNCLPYLRRIIEIVDPNVIVSLRAVALAALNCIKPHKLRLSHSVGKSVKWYNRQLLPLYHTSPRVLSIRSMAKQRKDFHKLSELLDSTKSRCRPAKLHSKLLLTGSTPIQVGSKRTKLKIITAASCWKSALAEMGYNVDWRPVVPGEDVGSYDQSIAILNKPNSIASAHIHGALWVLLSRPSSVLGLDDWQTQELIGGLRSCSKVKERLFRLRGSDIPGARANDLFALVNRLVNASWPWSVLAPILGIQYDLELLEIPAKITGIDPTAFATRYSCNYTCEKARKWILASLLYKSPPVTGWPLDLYGWQDRGRPDSDGRPYGKGIHAWPRLKEPELMSAYSGVWGVLSPMHPHAGSGWWRVRYLMAADAGCVLSADQREAECLGKAYTRASVIHRVENLSNLGLRKLAESQASCLRDIVWSKERVKDTLSTLLKKDTN